jgi:predicted helicase
VAEKAAKKPKRSPPMTPLSSLLNHYRHSSLSEREKGMYFEELMLCYLRNEATYRDLYSEVWTYGEWAALQGLDKRDTGIDLVAKTQGTDGIHAIQCKLYAEEYRLQKSDIDSFFTASGKKPFTHRVIVSTTNHWSTHAEDALRDQQPPVSKIDLNDLESSQIDWSKYQPKAAPVLKIKKQLRPHQQQALDAAIHGLQTADRGKLIMACGTGKTFTSLKIAEALAGRGKRVRNYSGPQGPEPAAVRRRAGEPGRGRAPVTGRSYRPASFRWPPAGNQRSGAPAAHRSAPSRRSAPEISAPVPSG